MQKLDMQTTDISNRNIRSIAQLFPQVITEKESEDGQIIQTVDWDLLKQTLSNDIVEGNDERYRLDWPGKRASILKANTPIDKTLRPVVADSVNWDKTENLYIEGDNFEILKVLQESYLEKVKMIYIDPPYNTGTAMIYTNDYSSSEDEFDESIGATDSDGIKLFKNTDTNGRFHSDWLSMMFERIIISRDLLKDDGFMALAIDHNELHTLTTICDEIFGEENRIGVITVVHKPEGRNQEKFFGTSNEFMLVYSKNRDKTDFNTVIIEPELAKKYNQNDNKGNFRFQNFIRLTDGKLALKEARPNFWYPVYLNLDTGFISTKKSFGSIEVYPITKSGIEMSWKTLPNTLQELINKNEIAVEIDKDNFITINEKIREDQVIKTHWIRKEYNSIQYGTKVITELLSGKFFDFPKSVHLVIDILKLTTNNDDIVLDFFSGSATTAHAVMQLNAEDGGSRKFIMVQIPEETDKDSEAYKAGYMNICQIGKERIRRAGKKIAEDNKDKEGIENLDIGFRVYRLDSSNMKDVFYHPTQVTQAGLFDLTSNIKDDRTPEDILSQVMLDLGLTLDLPIETRTVAGSTVYFVAGNSLVACFDEKVDFAIVDELAPLSPLKVVFRDNSFRSDADRINFETRFEKLSPDTVLQVL